MLYSLIYAYSTHVFGCGKIITYKEKNGLNQPLIRLCEKEYSNNWILLKLLITKDK